MLSSSPGGRRLSRTWYLPGRAPALRVEQFGSGTLEAAELEADALVEVLRGLRIGARDLRAIGAIERRRAVAAAAARMLEGGVRARVARALSAASGLSPAMAFEAIGRVFEVIREQAIARVLERDPGEPFEQVAIVSAGNVPGVAIPKMALALSAGASCFVKPGHGEPILAPQFAEALAVEHPVLARAVAVAWWRGGDTERELALGRESDSLITYGSDQAVAALARQTKGVFVGYGHRVSIGFVALDEVGDLASVARGAALEVAMYDQQGCLSPQCLFVTAPPAVRRRFCEMLGQELEAVSRRLPRGFVPEGNRVAIRRLRNELEWREIAGEDVRVLEGSDWTVIEEVRRAFRASPLYRTIIVAPLGDPSELGGTLGDVAARVETLGTAPFPFASVDEAARRAGIPNVVPLGEMQRPGLDWRAGGRSPLAGIVPEG